jgi:sugar lactone lactonase YvrE
MNKMKNLFTVMLLGSLTVNVCSQAQSDKKSSGFQHIESVVADGRYLYVADIGTALTPDAKDGDGKIVKLDSKGSVLEATFTKETLNAPKGLAIDIGILFLTDIDRLIAIDTNTGNTLYQIDFSQDAHFLNDIAVWDSNTLYVSATDNSKLFKVDLAAKSYTEVIIDKPIAGINGLFCNRKASLLYVNGMGSNNKGNGVVGYVNLRDNTFTQLTTAEGLYDGLSVVNGVLYTSNWVAFEKKGVLLSIQLSNRRISRLPLPEPIAGPADFVIEGNTIIVPAMLTGELHFIPIDTSLTQKL